MKRKKLFKSVLVLVLIVLTILAIKCVHMYNNYNSFRNNKADYNWSMMQRPFYSLNTSFVFMVKGKDIKLKMWAESLTGTVAVNITDSNNTIVFEKEFNNQNSDTTLSLVSGNYNYNIQVKNYTGGLYFGLDNVVVLQSLPSNNYKIIKADSEKGFEWDYILYTPEKLTGKNLLVIPNNTGAVDNILVHKQKAIGLIKWKSQLADDLGVPLLVPIFPRPKSYEDIYTHALDRNSLLTEIEELKRLDLQLIAMINDGKTLLKDDGIILDEKVLMSGFSASGDFTDRFTFLHPELVKAATIGGCDNMVPYANLNGENLPYPIGIYDYKDIAGKDFDLDSFASVNRFIYKGSKDEGGWQICNENGIETTYTGLEYYEQFLAPELAEFSDNSPTPIYTKGIINDIEKDAILFRIYDKKVLVDRFKLIKSIFEKENLNNNIFKVYEELEHETNDTTYQDELEFFKRVLNN